MQPNLDPQIYAVIETLLTQMQLILGDKLVGLYLYGSLVTGDFDPTISDIDLLAALASDLSPVEFDTLDAMHHDFIAQHPQWDSRLEIAYLSLHGLKTFRTEASAIGIISPGEPFHIIEAGHDWLVNWYVVREQGIPLFGPPAQAIIGPIATEEFIANIKDHAAHWHEWLKDDAGVPYQSYAILTMCRALYSCTHGEQVSKIRAAAWVMEQLPQWADLIQKALRWRHGWREDVADPAVILPETRRFVEFMQQEISHHAT